jgi:hypothetical protein
MGRAACPPACNFIVAQSSTRKQSWAKNPLMARNRRRHIDDASAILSLSSSSRGAGLLKKSAPPPPPHIHHSLCCIWMLKVKGGALRNTPNITLGCISDCRAVRVINGTFDSQMFIYCGEQPTPHFDLKPLTRRFGRPAQPTLFNALTNASLALTSYKGRDAHHQCVNLICVDHTLEQFHPLGA